VADEEMPSFSAKQLMAERRPYATLYEGGELVLRLEPGTYQAEAFF
jgi:hypothetical protein